MANIFAFLLDKQDSNFSEIESFILYTFAFLFSVLLAYLFSLLKPMIKKTPRILYSLFLIVNYIIIILPVVTVLGLRDQSVGYDTANYFDSYIRIGKYGLKDSTILMDTFEIGFALLQFVSYKLFGGKLIGAVFLQTFFAIFFFVIALDKWNNRKILPIGLFMYYMSFGIQLGNQTRQLLALSIVSIGFYYLYHNKHFWFVIFVLFAATFHMSSFFAFGLLLLNFINFKKKIARRMFIFGSFLLSIVLLYTINFFLSFLPKHYLYILEQLNEVTIIGYKWIVNVFPFIFTMLICGNDPSSNWGLNHLQLYTIPFRLGGYKTYFIMRLYYYPAIFSLQTMANLLCLKSRLIQLLVMIVFFFYYCFELLYFKTGGIMPFKILSFFER